MPISRTWQASYGNNGIKSIKYDTKRKLSLSQATASFAWAWCQPMNQIIKNSEIILQCNDTEFLHIKVYGQIENYPFAAK